MIKNLPINVEEEVKLKFDKLQFDLKVREKKKRSQSELVNMLMDFFKDNYKGVKIKKIK